METIFCHQLGMCEPVHRQMRDQRGTAWMGRPTGLHAIAASRFRTTIPSERLRQQRKTLYRRQARKQHVPEARALLQQTQNSIARP